MKVYLVSHAAGMLVGEQVVPAAQRLRFGRPLSVAWFRAECVPKITGLPGHHESEQR